MTDNVERQVIGLIAVDRLDVPISSMSGKLKRTKPKLAREVEIPGQSGSRDKVEFEGDRVYARVEQGDKMKARGVKEGIEKFEGEFPRHGRILRGYIEEQRTLRETHLYFGVNQGCRLTADDYMVAMQSLGLTEVRARELYPVLMDVSRNLARKRQEERSVMLDSTL